MMFSFLVRVKRIATTAIGTTRMVAARWVIVTMSGIDGFIEHGGRPSR